MMDDALIQQLLHDLDGHVSVCGLLVLNQPINKLLSHKAVGVGTEMMPTVFDDFALMESQSRKEMMIHCSVNNMN